MVEKNSKEMAKIAVAALEEKKAKDIKILDISGVSVLADYFIIASGSNRNQVQAMADEAQEKLYKAGYEAKQVEGYQRHKPKLEELIQESGYDAVTVYL